MDGQAFQLLDECERKLRQLKRLNVEDREQFPRCLRGEIQEAYLDGLGRSEERLEDIERELRHLREQHTFL